MDVICRREAEKASEEVTFKPRHRNRKEQKQVKTRIVSRKKKSA